MRKKVIIITLVLFTICIILIKVINKNTVEYISKKDINKEEIIHNPPKEINFGDYYEIAYDESIMIQDKLDNNYLVGAYGDYYHHNDEGFMTLFNVLDKTQKIIIDNKEFKFVSYTEGLLQEKDNSIKIQDGSIVENNDRVEIITCMTEENNPNRLIAVLEEVK